jgi:hypothetical protein
MEYNSNQLEKVQEYAGLLMNVSDISVLIGVNEDSFREDIGNKNTAVSSAYRKGKIETVLELRKQEIDLAKLGSPMAVELIQKYIIDQKMSENG